MRGKLLAAAVVLISLTTTFTQRAIGDHLPPELQAKGKPETTLAGIRLDMALRDIVATYGPPSERKRYPDGRDECSWIRSGVSLHVSFYPGDVKGTEVIQAIEVTGRPTKSRLGRTGRGLRLGHTLQAIKRVYGNRFHERNVPGEGIHQVWVQWKEDITLIAEFDPSGHIKAITLLPPE